MDNENMDEQESLNPEGEQGTLEPEIGSDVVEKLTKAEELAKNQKIRAEKAEAELKRLKAESAKPNEIKSNEPDERIDKLTLRSEGITNPDDQKIVLDEAKRLKLPVEEVASMEHIKSRLKTAQAQREAESGMPEGKGKAGGSSKNTVEYWMNKTKSDGTYDTPDDLELANEVINARIKQHEKQNTFSDEMYI